jgi:Spy/CpxP family protein refolding chaperone
MGKAPTTPKEFEMSQANSRTDPITGLARQRGLKRLVAAVLVAGSATFALSAWSSHGLNMEAGRHRMGPPPIGGPAMLMGFGGPGLFMGPRALDQEHLNRSIDRMLDGLNATDAQRAQIKDIARVAAVDLKAQREQLDGKSLRDKSLQLFTAPTIDAGAIEQLRQQMEAAHDRSARRVTQAMIDIGRVLTPEQRATAGQLARYQADRMEDRVKRMREHPEEMGRGGHRHGGPDDGPPAAPAAATSR